VDFHFIRDRGVLYFFALDKIFRAKQRIDLPMLKVGQSIIQVNGQYYVVEERGADPVPEYLPKNVVQLHVVKK